MNVLATKQNVWQKPFYSSPPVHLRSLYPSTYKDIRSFRGQAIQQVKRKQRETTLTSVLQRIRKNLAKNGSRRRATFRSRRVDNSRCRGRNAATVGDGVAPRSASSSRQGGLREAPPDARWKDRPFARPPFTRPPPTLLPILRVRACLCVSVRVGGSVVCVCVGLGCGWGGRWRNHTHCKPVMLGLHVHACVCVLLS